MVHGTLNITILTTRRKMPHEIECQHIAEVTTMLRHFFVDISVEYFCLMTERIRAEGMLGVEGKRDVLLHLIRGCEIPCGSLMSWA